MPGVWEQDIGGSLREMSRNSPWRMRIARRAWERLNLGR